MNFLKRLVLTVKVFLAAIRANFFKDPDPDYTLHVSESNMLEVLLYDNGYIDIYLNETFPDGIVSYKLDDYYLGYQKALETEYQTFDNALRYAYNRIVCNSDTLVCLRKSSLFTATGL